MPTRTVLRGLGWVLAVLASGWACWTMWHPPGPATYSPIPEALPRPASAAERTEVERQAKALARSIAAAEARTGQSPEVHALEAIAPDDQPWLPDGLPDNALTPAVAWAHPHCPGQPMPTPPPDWLVCSQDGTVRAGGLTNPTSWPYRTAPASSAIGKE